MSARRRLPTPPRGERITWTYFVSRDSVRGELSGVCALWYAKPLRVKTGYRVTWVGGNDRDPCYLGAFPAREIVGWFNTCPDTDMELIRVEQYPTEQMLAAAKAQA